MVIYWTTRRLGHVVADVDFEQLETLLAVTRFIYKYRYSTVKSPTGLIKNRRDPVFLVIKNTSIELF